MNDLSIQNGANTKQNSANTQENIQNLDQIVFFCQRKLQNIKIEELEEAEKKISKIIKQFKSNLKESEEDKNQKGLCAVFHERKMEVMIGLTVANFLFSSAGLACGIFGADTVVKWGGFIFSELTFFAGGGTGIYATKISLDAEKKAKMEGINQKGLVDAKLFKKFIKSFKELKKDQYKELKHTVKRMEKRKSQLMDYLDKHDFEVNKSNLASSQDAVSPSSPHDDNSYSPKQDLEVVMKKVDEVEKSRLSQSFSSSSNLNLSQLVTQPMPAMNKEEDIKQEDSRNRVDPKNNASYDVMANQCLRYFEALPKKYRGLSCYLKVVSECIFQLPEDDSLKKEWQSFEKHKEDHLIEEIYDEDHSVQVATNNNNSNVEKEMDVHLEILEVDELDHQQKNAMASKEIAFEKISDPKDQLILKKYEHLVDLTRKRFQIQPNIPYLDTPNGYRMTSRGTMRISKQPRLRSSSGILNSSSESYAENHDEKSTRTRSESNFV